MMTRLPLNARSECVAPSTCPVGGVVESMRMFHAAWAASQRPALSPTRGSGVGAVAAAGTGVAAGGGVLGAAAADAPLVEELAHPGTPSAAVANRTPNKAPVNSADGRGRDDANFM